MEVVLFNIQNRTFTLRGRCPHGPHEGAFLLVAGVHTEKDNWLGAMQCQGCAKYILAFVQLQHFANNVDKLAYREHYPLGRPDDVVAQEIPDHIKPDFQEALRCLWVNAYNATAEMCRRALEASCLQLGAPGKGTLERCGTQNQAWWQPRGAPRAAAKPERGKRIGSCWSTNTTIGANH
jgi:hypothetical protein